MISRFSQGNVPVHASLRGALTALSQEDFQQRLALRAPKTSKQSPDSVELVDLNRAATHSKYSIIKRLNEGYGKHKIIPLYNHYHVCQLSHHMERCIHDRLDFRVAWAYWSVMHGGTKPTVGFGVSQIEIEVDKLPAILFLKLARRLSISLSS